MLRLFRSKLFLLSLTTILILIVMGVSVNRDSKLNWLSNTVSVPLTPVQQFFTSAGQKVGDAFSFFKDMQVVKDENEQLKARVNELEKENRELQSFRDKNEKLREALNLKQQFDDFTIVGANIIAIDPGNWFNIFKIDLGGRDGIRADLPVVTGGKGLVGRVLSSDLTSSKVLTIIDEDFAVAGWISKVGGGHVIIRGDLTLKEKGLCKMDYIPLDIDVEVGDVVETSGLGGIYPKGIVIGKVIEVRKTNSEMNRYAVIEPVADFKKLEEVFVLKSPQPANNEETGSVIK